MDFIIGIDEVVFTFINKSLSSAFLDAVLIPIRHKLFWLPMYLFIIFFVSYNFGKIKWLIFLFFAITIGISDTASSKIIKPTVSRIRPCHIQRMEPNVKIPCSYGYSFPSSHATNHFAIATFLFFLFGFWRLKWLLLAWAGVISFAQVYVGVHYPLDVLVGSLLGLVIGYLVYKIYDKLLLKYKLDIINVA